MTGVRLGELRREIGRARRRHKHIELDLEEVTLVDRYSVTFLAEQASEGMRLVHCPAYIEPWIEKEKESAPSSEPVYYGTTGRLHSQRVRRQLRGTPAPTQPGIQPSRGNGPASSTFTMVR
jgi:hypothetical protein